jgi:hypothetical protein
MSSSKKTDVVAVVAEPHRRNHSTDAAMGSDFHSEKTTTLINSILTVTLKTEMVDGLESLKREPKDVGKGYMLSVLSGSADGPPEVISCQEAGLPERGEATGYVFALKANVIFKQDTTAAEEPIVLMLESKHAWQPNMFITVRSYTFDCEMHIENSPGLGYTLYYFLA